MRIYEAKKILGLGEGIFSIDYLNDVYKNLEKNKDVELAYKTYYDYINGMKKLNTYDIEAYVKGFNTDVNTLDRKDISLMSININNKISSSLLLFERDADKTKNALILYDSMYTYMEGEITKLLDLLIDTFYDKNKELINSLPSFDILDEKILKLREAVVSKFVKNPSNINNIVKVIESELNNIKDSLYLFKLDFISNKWGDIFLVSELKDKYLKDFKSSGVDLSDKFKEEGLNIYNRFIEPANKLKEVFTANGIRSSVYNVFYSSMLKCKDINDFERFYECSVSGIDFKDTKEVERSNKYLDLLYPDYLNDNVELFVKRSGFKYEVDLVQKNRVLNIDNDRSDNILETLLRLNNKYLFSGEKCSYNILLDVIMRLYNAYLHIVKKGDIYYAELLERNGNSLEVISRTEAHSLSEVIRLMDLSYRIRGSFDNIDFCFSKDEELKKAGRDKHV